MQSFPTDSPGGNNTHEPTFLDVGQSYIVLFQRKYTKLLDDSSPFPLYRWIGTLSLFILYALRVFFLEGFYIVTYALGIYLLNMFIQFLTPKIDPSDALDTPEEDQEEDEGLPTTKDDEFRPFVRRLPEFKFWHNTTRAVVLSIFCTLFPFLDVPVFWPILLIYWAVLVFVTMRKQIRHMIKYKYIPFSFGKPRFAGKTPETVQT
eukprot:CAMPEP_0119120086 /NCGR_PEP_ID=MMETSP1310-20130426/1290_1 /TAXON_ID=464262 /ORGANISM="Genus nov. species nov., Strain RCC2339" /LENGTH=204 /DNA_ID=CAMNT_0007109549 /DNA_START=164 /DNA_END=778 /DNA_ORIENTATION=+